MNTVELQGKEFRQNGKAYVNLLVPHTLLEKTSFIKVFSEDNEDGDQRPIKLAHAKEFSESITSKEATHPQSIMGTLFKGKVVQARNYNISKSVNNVIVELPSGSGEYIRIHDGNHSITAVSNVTDDIKDDWVWSVVLSTDSNIKTMKRHHNSINANQKAVDKAVLKYSDIMIGVGTDDEIRVGRKIFDRLRKDSFSVLYKRIKTHHNQVKPGRCGTNALGFNEFINRSAVNGHNILSLDEVRALSDDDLYEIVKAYYNKWAEIAGDDWNETRIYMLGDKIGLKVLTECMVNVFSVVIKLNGLLSVDALEEFIDSKVETETGKSSFRRTWALKTGSDKWGHKAVNTVKRAFLTFLDKKTRQRRSK